MPVSDRTNSCSVSLSFQIANRNPQAVACTHPHPREIARKLVLHRKHTSRDPTRTLLLPTNERTEQQRWAPITLQNQYSFFVDLPLLQASFLPLSAIRTDPRSMPGTDCCTRMLPTREAPVGAPQLVRLPCAGRNLRSNPSSRWLSSASHDTLRTSYYSRQQPWSALFFYAWEMRLHEESADEFEAVE